MTRPAALNDFISATHSALSVAPTGPAKTAVTRIFAALQTPESVHKPQALPPPGRLAQTLPAALNLARKAEARISQLADAFAELAPLLRWEPRVGSESDPSFHENHVNTAIVGPTGIEQRSDVIVGAGLLNPHTTYPTHSHPPEELYIVMSNSEWFNEDDQWYAPALGGIVYHRCGIHHAMRSLETPLLAVWCLYVE